MEVNLGLPLPVTPCRRKTPNCPSSSNLATGFKTCSCRVEPQAAVAVSFFNQRNTGQGPWETASNIPLATSVLTVSLRPCCSGNSVMVSPGQPSFQNSSLPGLFAHCCRIFSSSTRYGPEILFCSTPVFYPQAW